MTLPAGWKVAESPSAAAQLPDGWKLADPNTLPDGWQLEPGVLGSAGSLFARGALDQGAGATAEGTLRVADATDRANKTRFALGDEHAGLARTLGELERAEALGPSTARQTQIAQIRDRIATLERQAAPQIADIQAAPGLKPAAESVGEFRQAVRDVYPVAPEVERSIPGQVIAGVGQAIGGMPAFLTGIGIPASAAQLFDQGFSDAKQSGADDETAMQAGLANMPAAVLEQFGDKLQLSGLVKALRTGTQSTAKQIGRRVAEATVGEAGTEAGQQVYQNVIARELYAPERGVTEGAGEAALVGGLTGGTVATGTNVAGELLRRAAGAPPTPTQSRELVQTPSATITREATLPAQDAPGKTAGAPAPAPSTATSDLEADIAAALPDAESRDVLAGRSAEATARDLKNVAVDFGATVETVKDALLAADVTPAQLDALDFQLRVLEERKDKRRLKAEQVNASLSATFLMEALPAADVFPLVSKLAENARNIGALRQGLASLRAPGQQAPVTAQPAPAAPNPVTSQVLTPEQRTAKAQALQEREQAAAVARQQAEVAQQQQRERAAQDAKEQKQRIRSETARLAAVEATGRDPDTKRIVDLTRVPDAELDLIDLDAEGVTAAQLEAEMERRARAAERAQATETNRGDELLDVLEEIKLPSSDEALGAEMALLTRENMTPRQRMTLLGSTARGLDATAEALRERGFAWAQTPADVIDAVQRALRGEKIYASSTGDGAPRFRRPAAPTRVDPARRTAAERQWTENFRLIAPGVARQFDLRFASPESLVEDGTVNSADLTGEEEAAFVRRREGALRGIVYLFDRALRQNTDQQTRINLLHEMAHAYWDTLDPQTRENLSNQWVEEIANKQGPLYKADGFLREGVALGVKEDVQEWFAERLAQINDAWANRRTLARRRGDSVLQVVAAELRQLLNRLLELLQRAGFTERYADDIVRDFRKFLDQGERFAETELPDTSELAPSFAVRDDDAATQLRGRTVTLEATENNEAVEVEMDAAEAWQETNQRLAILRKLRDCLTL